MQFRKDKADIWALNNSASEVNVMSPAYAKQLDLQTQKTDVGAQKIYGLSLDIFRIVITDFQVINKLGRAQSVQETFLLANTSIKVVLKMSFLTLSNANI